MAVFQTKRVTHKHREKFDLHFFHVTGEVRRQGTRFPHEFLTPIVLWYKTFDMATPGAGNIRQHHDFAMTTKQLAHVMLSKSSSKKARVFVSGTHDLGQHLTTQLGTDLFTFATAIKFFVPKANLAFTSFECTCGDFSDDWFIRMLRWLGKTSQTCHAVDHIPLLGLHRPQ